MTASQALARFKARTLSPVELLEALIERAEEVELKVNAFSYRHFDQAMEQAKRAEARFMKSGDDIRPLEGLPIAVKDGAYIKGMPTSSASLAMRDFVPDSTSAHVERILEAGGIIHARSATPEFSCAAYCHSKLWGVTRNPRNLEYTPGGSSGGSGACLAAGTAALASGSDIAGSIRIPASCCGVVGYKPPHGRNPVDTLFNLDPYCHTGPMARSLADAILLQNVISGPHPQDIATLRPKLVLPADYQSIKGWKVAYSLDLGFFEVDSEVLANTLNALDMFSDLGARVEEVMLDWDWSVLEAGSISIRLVHILRILLSFSLQVYLCPKIDKIRY
jgi:amidase